MSCARISIDPGLTSTLGLARQEQPRPLIGATAAVHNRKPPLPAFPRAAVELVAGNS